MCQTEISIQDNRFFFDIDICIKSHVCFLFKIKQLIE